MKILKHGGIKPKIMRFECPCGCIFEADSFEYETTSGLKHDPVNFFHVVTQYSIKCPDCGELVGIYEEYTQKSEGI